MPKYKQDSAIWKVATIFSQFSSVLLWIPEASWDQGSTRIFKNFLYVKAWAACLESKLTAPLYQLQTVHLSVLNFCFSPQVQTNHTKGLFHVPHVTVPHTAPFSYNTAYLCEEENVAQLFISSEGSAKSNSNISREAFVLKVASSCWADVPVRKHVWQWERQDTQSSNCKSSTRRGTKTSFQKGSWDGVKLLFLLLRYSPT